MNLPKDALIEIMRRLPVKSLVRFRYLSKSWFSLLKSPCFIDIHLKFSLARDDEHILVNRFSREEGKHILSFHSNDESLSFAAPNLVIQDYDNDSLKMVGCCNGIVCLSSSDDFVLCNPAMRQLRVLPPRPFGCPEGCHCMTEGVGFGFDPASNDYKFVRITCLDDPSHPGYPYNYGTDPRRAEIYNLSNDTWRKLDVILPRIGSQEGFDLFFNGNIHWYTTDRRDTGKWILSLNISSEVFHKFRFPEACQNRMIEQRVSLAIINSTLAVVLYTNRFPNPHPYEQFINIWTMKEYGVEESWSKQYCLGPLSGIKRPISIWKNEWLLLESEYGECYSRANVMGHDGQLVACNLLNYEQLQKYDIYGFEHTLEVVFYKESLFSIIDN